MEAIGMYIGDGKLSADLNHLEFTSIDKDMLDFMSKFFQNRFNLDIKGFTNREYAFQINGKIFRILFEKIIDKIYESNFQRDFTLRRAFLRGLFAAEGTIGINRQENYIVHIQYCLNIDEDKIAHLIRNSLDSEGISHVTKKEEKDNSMSIRMTNWKNYYKLWKIDLFSSNQRKNKIFLDKVKKTKFFFEIKEEFIKKLLNSSGLSHRQIALKLGIAPATLCNLNKRKTLYMNRKDLSNLANFNGISINEVKENILGIRVNRVTVLDDMELIDSII